MPVRGGDVLALDVARGWLAETHVAGGEENFGRGDIGDKGLELEGVGCAVGRE